MSLSDSNTIGTRMQFMFSNRKRDRSRYFGVGDYYL